jgi:hypothetical protein
MSGEPRCYTTEEILAKLNDMPRSTWEGLKRRGKLPFLQELLPRLGRHPRYRADLVDLYVAGRWGQSRAFGGRLKRSA